MTKEQIFGICNNLIDKLTVLKGFIQLNKMNNKIDHSIVVLQELDDLERMIKELVDKLLALE